MANMTPRQKANRKERLVEEFGERCSICGRVMPADQLTIDHVESKGEGGSNSYSNLRLACYDCNYGRHH